MPRSLRHDEIIHCPKGIFTVGSCAPHTAFSTGQCGGSFYRKLQNLVLTITLALSNDAAGVGRTLSDLRQSGRKSAHEGLLLRYCSGVSKFD